MKLKLTHGNAEALPPGEKTYIVYDAALPGFACRVTPAGAKSWTYEYRPGGGRRAATRRITLGRIETMPCHRARTAAQKMHYETRLGADPVAARQEHRDAPTVEEIAARFLDEHVRPKRAANTLALYTRYFDGYIFPAIGKRRARDVTHADVDKLHRTMGAQDIKTTANRVRDLIGTTFRWAGKARLIPRDHNPARDVSRYRERARENYLTGDQFAALGDALHEAETVGIPWTVDEDGPKAKHAPRPENRRQRFPPHVTAAFRLLVLTGCRCGEILNARWEDVDWERGQLVLPKSKTGPRRVPLSAAALAVLNDLPRIGVYIVAGETAGAPRADLNRPWRAIRRRAGLENITIHDLRHAFASTGVGIGLGLPIVGKLLGHTVPTTTARYSHLDVDPLRRATDRIGAVIDAALTRKPGAAVVSLKK